MAVEADQVNEMPPVILLMKLAHGEIRVGQSRFFERGKNLAEFCVMAFPVGRENHFETFFDHGSSQKSDF